jgi:hypothetical protein
MTEQDTAPVVNEQENVTFSKSDWESIRQEFLKEKELNALLVAEINQKRDDLAKVVSANKQLGEKLAFLTQQSSPETVSDEVSGD